MSRYSALRAQATFVLAALTFAASASAQDDWKTVTLDGGVRISVPTVVGEDYRPSADIRAKGLLMFFAVSTDRDNLICALQREPYTAKLTHEAATQVLASSRRDAFCASEAGVTNVSPRGSQPATSNGYPAGLCAASYTRAGEQSPGRQDAVLTIAAPAGLYILKCTVQAETQKAAQEAWDVDYGETFDHLRNSLQFTGGGK